MRHLSSPAVTGSQRETAGKHTTGGLTGSVVGRQQEGKGTPSMLADCSEKEMSPARNNRQGGAQVPKFWGISRGGQYKG